MVSGTERFQIKSVNKKNVMCLHKLVQNSFTTFSGNAAALSSGHWREASFHSNLPYGPTTYLQPLNSIFRARDPINKNTSNNINHLNARS